MKTRDVFTNPWLFCGAGFGAGLAPVAPGTWGTVVGLVIAWGLSFCGESFYWLVTAFVCVVGIPICAHSAKALGVHDHPGIVWDEIAGYLVTLSVVPLTVSNLIGGFVLFRIADIVKPWPANVVDKKVHGGFGIMLDDVVAAVYAAGVLFMVNRYWPNWI